MIGPLLRLAFGAATRGGAARGATVAAERGALSRIFGFGARHPVIATGAAAVADQQLNGGRGTTALFNAARNGIMNNLRPENGGDWLQIGAGVLAGLNAFQGNYMGAAMFGAAMYYMDDILRIADNFLESKGIDIIPDNWHDGSTPAAAPAGPAPA